MRTEIRDRPSLARFAWLSIGAAVLTISLKAAAYFLTGSVSLLSDALEAVVNLAGALMALTMITIAVRPADEEHTYGHSKAEYFSSGVEGTLILIAAVSIIITAIPRLFSPQPLEQIGLGIAVSIMAAAINLAVALVLMKVGKRYQSISLEANAHHLLTDVWTTVGVLIGVAVVVLTGWERLDPIIALIVAANIVWSGYRLIRNSVLGLMDTALPVEERDKIQSVLAPYMQSDVEFHALRTRQSGMRKFVSMHVLVPGSWTVQRGHQLLERIEADIRAELSNVTVFTHLEPFDDPASWKDTDLDRVEISPLDGDGNTSTDT
jgi:cation diffusion facilitator family transporter